MEDETTQDRSLSRRTLIRRSAIFSGSLVWAAPVVQSLGGSAFASTTGGSPAPGGNAPSNVVLLLCDGLYYQVKFDAGDPDMQCGANEDPPLPTGAREAWNALTAGFTISAECPPGVSGQSGDTSQPICVDVGDCEIVLWGVFDGGGGTQVFFTNNDPIPTGFSVTVTGTTICFAKDF